MERLVIGFGSNLGDREKNIRLAREGLAGIWRRPRFSQVYETLPWGVAEQPLFLNQVGVGLTNLTPLAVLEELKALEVRLGREPGPRYGPRLIDLDILAYGDWVFISEVLCIPHGNLAERAFVLAPLAEVLPEYQHPLTRLTPGEMLEKLNPDPESYRVYRP